MTVKLSKKQRRALRKAGTLDPKQTVPQRGMNLRNINPKTSAQSLTFDAYDAGNHLLLHGTAGTGKTFISTYLALRDIFEGTHDDDVREYDKIVFIRSVVPTRDIGFLPGTEDQKIQVYEQPYKDICNDIFGRSDAYGILKHKGLVDFMCTSFVRGLTIDRAIVIVDEMQNMSGHELSSVITRLGDDCRVMFCGDFSQSDLTKRSEKDGLHKFMQVIDRIDGFDHIEFTRNDIVRSKLVKDFIIAQDDLGISLCA